jgi:LuxR family maltose regulon positive regulatory protein
MVQVIAEKINPPQELPRVSRGRLLSLLAESMEVCNSTIIHGRAGTGKTMLAADFARRCGRPSAWYKLDAPDCELHVFLRYLCAAVARVRPGFGRKTLEGAGTGAGVDDVPVLVESLIYELLETAEPLLVVIDDLHLVYDAEWVTPFFRRLLPLLPREVHVVLLGRGMPPAPLWRMRSKQTLCVLEEEALAFTGTEARALFASYGLTAAAADAALKPTRGRASTLDARARSSLVADEKERPAAAPAPAPARERQAAQRPRPLRLVKGFRKSSLGTA